MRPRAWLLAAALAALATGSAACGVADAGDLDVAGRRSGASAAAHSGGFTALLEDDVRAPPSRAAARSRSACLRGMRCTAVRGRRLPGAGA
jgi:hypothetical protein